jgi:hypothetical protein
MSNVFEFIRVEGGVKFMKHFKVGASYKSLGTSALTQGHILQNVMFHLPSDASHMLIDAIRAARDKHGCNIRL